MMGVQFPARVRYFSLCHSSQAGYEAHQASHPKAMPWLRQLVTGLLLRRLGFTPRFVQMGFVMYKVALELVFLQVFGFTLSISFHHGFPCSYIIWGMNNRTVGGRSSETQ
jgi:hypothetical protein